jgi:hypothetical protein
MPSTKSTPKRPVDSPGSKAPRSGELKGDDLDKVVGGLKSSGGPRPKGGDPCDGGE